jgi:hypothetical protein
MKGKYHQRIEKQTSGVKLKNVATWPAGFFRSLAILDERKEGTNMADLTREQMKLLDEHDQHQQEMMKEQLSQLGVQLRVAHFQGDNSYPTEYTLRYSFVSAVGPTFGLALTAFVEALLKYVPVEKA